MWLTFVKKYDTFLNKRPQPKDQAMSDDMNDPTYEDFNIEDASEKRRSPIPDRVKTLSKLDRSTGQVARWTKVDVRVLKALYEEFGFTPFSLEDAEDCGYLDNEDISVASLMRRMLKLGWYTTDDEEEYRLTDLGEAKYEEKHPFRDSLF
jgi:hypothetical protein